MNRIIRNLAIIIVGVIIIAAGGYGAYQIMSSQRDSTPVVSTENPPTGAPQLNIAVLTAGLDHPWDISFLPDQTLLFTERSGAINKLSDGTKVQIERPSDVVAQGEGGMLGLTVDPKFSENRYVYACFNSNKEKPSVRVVRWEMNDSQTALRDRTDIVTDIPSNPSGRHSGCRIDFGPDDNLWIGTGDAADQRAPQDTRNLGGKILRVDREGKGATGNTIADADPRVFSFGHRNTQGLVFFDTMQGQSYGYSAEHGSDRDDEINQLVSGNFGWAPGAGYDESVPMTDSQKFPQAVPATWSSGAATIAVADLTILNGSKWKDWQNRLAVSVLKDKHLRLIQITDGKVTNEQKILNDSYGRLRASVLGPDGSLYLSTDNGGGEDRIIRVIPL